MFQYLSFRILNTLVLLSSLLFAVNSFADNDGTWTYDIDGSEALVTGCVGTCPRDLIIPAEIDGYSVTSIGDSAFYNNQLTSVTIPDSVISIGRSAFRDNQLSNVTIPDSVTSIGDVAFFNNQLIGVTIGNSVTSIGESAFRDNSLTSVTFPDSLISIGENAFLGNQLTSLTIGNSVTSIGDWAFSDNQLTSVTIPDSVISIGRSAFRDNQLTNVTIPDSVTSIGDVAFYNNQLISVTIGNSVTSIGESAFRDNLLTNVTIPDSVISIGGLAFYNNQLISVTIGNSVTSIGESAFRDNQLTNVTIPDSVTSIGGVAFYNNQLISVTIGNSVTSIGESAFRDNQLTNVTVPDSVTSIGGVAFYNNQLISVTIGNSVTSIGDWAFSNNILSIVHFLGDRPAFSSNSFQNNSLNTITYCSDTNDWPGDPIENITPINDCDGDGIRNDVDTDNDGLPDTYEVANDLDPLNALDAEQDKDNDGLTNLQEFSLGTDINNSDTDGDGLTDDIDKNPLVFDDTPLSIPSGRLHVLPDINADGIAEIGVLRVDMSELKVRLQILDGKDKANLYEIVWVDNFTDSSLSLHLIPDMNDNGYDEVGLFGIQDGVNREGKPQMFVRDLKTGSKVGDVYNWVANWTGVSALVLDDISGDGKAEIAIQGRFKEGNRPQLIVKMGNSNTILDTFGYPDLVVSPQYYQHSDVDGDGFAEISLFGRLNSNNKIQAKIASGIDAATKMKAYNFPDKWDNVSWHRLDDSNADGIDDWGLFGTNKQDGRPQLINKDGSDPRGALRIFAWPTAMQSAQFFRIPDMNNDGVDEVAAAGQRSNNGRYQFQVQDGVDRNSVLANHNLSLNLENVTYHVLPDLSGDEKIEIGFLGLNNLGEYELFIRHGDTANGELASFNLGSDWQTAPVITSIGDTDDNGLPDLLIYGQNAAADQLVITTLNASSLGYPDPKGFSLFGYGRNISGQLGNGTFTTPAGAVAIDVNVTKISAGGEHSLYLKSDGTLWGMGENSYGQLGDGTGVDSATPILIDTNVAKISAGFSHSLYIKKDGSLWGMGDNQSGELGTGSQSNFLVPRLIDNNVAEAAAGTNHFGTHSLYIKTDGTLMGMGVNSNSQLGDGTTTPRPSPIIIDTNVAFAAAANFHSLYVKSDGSLYAMGWNSFGQLGDGSSENRTTPVLVDTGVANVSGGNNHSYYLKTNGNLMAMGANINGPESSALTPILKDTSITEISAGMQQNGVYTKSDGTLRNLVDGSQVTDGVTTASAGGYHVLYIKSPSLNPPSSTSLRACSQILIDASRGAGVWWFPQSGAYDPEQPHQGKELADHLRSLDANVDETPQNSTITATQLSEYDIVVRAGGYTTGNPYSSDEIQAYVNYLASGGSVFLIADHECNGSLEDGLADAMGLDFQGCLSGTISDYEQHPIAEGATPMLVSGGSYVTSPPATMTVIGRLNGQPMLGAGQVGSGPIVFLGDLNVIEGVPQPLTDNIFDFLCTGNSP